MLDIFHKNAQLTAYLWANSASNPISRPGCIYMSSGFKPKLGQRRPCKIPALSKRSPLPPNLPLHLTMPFVFFSSICEAFVVHILLPYEAQIVPQLLQQPRPHSMSWHTPHQSWETKRMRCGWNRQGGGGVAWLCWHGCFLKSMLLNLPYVLENHAS